MLSGKIPLQDPFNVFLTDLRSELVHLRPPSSATAGSLFPLPAEKLGLVGR
jgi:hypothetical protein